MRVLRANEAVGGGAAAPSNASLYDRLERGLIALAYALADARSGDTASEDLDSFVRSQEALQGAGEQVQDALLALRTAGLRSAAERARRWAREDAVTP